MPKANSYRVTAFLPLACGTAMLGLDLNVHVAQPLEWVQQHADEIAQFGINQDVAARQINGGVHTALAVAVV